MSQLRFLFDEDTDPDLIDALLRREPSVDVLRVGGRMRPFRHSGPELLIAAEHWAECWSAKPERRCQGIWWPTSPLGRHTHGVALVAKRLFLSAGGGRSVDVLVDQ